MAVTRLGPNKDIIYSELALTGYLMFRKERRESMGYSVILYIKEYIQADEITLKNEADCEEAILCNIVTKNSTVTISKTKQRTRGRRKITKGDKG